jgi:hypothetical protein
MLPKFLGSMDSIREKQTLIANLEDFNTTLGGFFLFKFILIKI